MDTELPAPIAAFVNAQNAHDTAALLSCFTDDAVVHDEERDHRGKQAIRAWSDDVIRRYQLSSEVLGVERRDEGLLVRALVSGTFDGSPAELSWLFAIRGDKIAEMRTL